MFKHQISYAGTFIKVDFFKVRHKELKLKHVQKITGQSCKNIQIESSRVLDNQIKQNNALYRMTWQMAIPNLPFWFKIFHPSQFILLLFKMNLPSFRQHYTIH